MSKIIEDIWGYFVGEGVTSHAKLTESNLRARSGQRDSEIMSVSDDSFHTARDGDSELHSEDDFYADDVSNAESVSESGYDTDGEGKGSKQWMESEEWLENEQLKLSFTDSQHDVKDNNNEREMLGFDDDVRADDDFYSVPPTHSPTIEMIYNATLAPIFSFSPTLPANKTLAPINETFAPILPGNETLSPIIPGNETTSAPINGTLSPISIKQAPGTSPGLVDRDYALIGAGSGVFLL